MRVFFSIEVSIEHKAGDGLQKGSACSNISKTISRRSSYSPVHHEFFTKQIRKQTNFCVWKISLSESNESIPIFIPTFSNITYLDPRAPPVPNRAYEDDLCTRNCGRQCLGRTSHHLRHQITHVNFPFVSLQWWETYLFLHHSPFDYVNDPKGFVQ